MYAAHPCASDAALLDDLAMSGTFPDIAWRPQPLAAAAASSGKMAATRASAKQQQQQLKKQKQKKRLVNANTLSFPLHAPSGTIRQALFPTGPGSYPSPTMALQHNAQALVDRRQRVRADVSGSTESEVLLDHKRRETGWNTSFPAEYAKSSPAHDFQQTLAYHEQLHRLHDQQQQSEVRAAVPTSGAGASGVKSDYGSPTQSIERLVLLKEVSMREGLLAKLTALVQSAVHDQDFGTERGNELLHLLLQLRDASVQVMQAIANWHRSLRSGPRAFVVDEQHYALKMVSDLNFLAKTKALGQILGVSPARMKQNPFMMPAPMPERDFHAVQSLPWSKTERTFSSDPVERVADAEKYLVWCLFHLGDAAPSPHGQAGELSPSHRPQPLPANYSGTGSTTWQKRAEKQLQLLSMPLEAPTGQTHIMDSSRMMKRKGYLPSLPLSPPKTLTDLIDTVHTGNSSTQHTVPRRVPAVMHLRANWNGVTYTTSSRDLEALGAMENPPHHMATLVAASILILLSPSDRIPKDLSWPSCRKMLASGAKLVDCMDRFQVASVPPFKLKALVPFLQNEHFQPKFLSEFSRAAGALCAWVFASLAAAQNQEVATSRSDEDRLDLLGELEVEDALGDDSSAPHALESDATAKRKSTKRVTIGNAEVLFINENQPMSCSSTPRPASRGETPLARKKSSVLLRTSPWTFRGVTYFVSFFLEATETALSIKLYEPMSSVESQIFVTEEDLEVDFGAHASDLFQARDFRPLCDLILHRLDDMMTGEKLSAQRQEQAMATGESRWELQAPDAPERVDSSEKTSEALESAAAAIDLLELEGDDYDNEPGDARDERQHASEDDSDGCASKDNVDESVLRIQCAARQRLARDRVKHVRFEQASKRELLCGASAVKIQSLARQNLAKKEVARMRLENRVPTGLPTDELMARAAKQELLGQPLEGISDNGHRVVEEDEEDEEDEEEEARAPPVGHFRSADAVAGALSSARPEDGGDVENEDAAQRPDTVMSYGSEQFEDDFEQDEDA